MQASIYIATSLIDDLFDCLHRQLALLQVAQLAPKNTAMQANHAIQTMVFISFAQKYTPTYTLREEKDPRPAQMDTLATGKIDREPLTENKGRVQEKVLTMATERSKHSFRSGRFAKDASLKEPTPSIKQNKSVKAKQQSSSFFVSLCPEAEEEDVPLETMRQAENDRVALEGKIKRQHELQNRQREKKAVLGLKLLKEKKSYTFDYEGTSHAVSPPHLPSEVLRKMRQELKGGEVLKHRDMMCETTHISYKQKQEMGKSMKGVEAPVFSQKGFSVIETLGDNSHLSEGIKITELRGNSDNLTLERLAKRPEGKAYRLKEYRDLSKDKSFREFPLASSRKNSLLDFTDSNIDPQKDQKLVTIKKERVLPSRGRSEEMIKAQKAGVLQEALGRGLPFIRTKGLKFYDIGSANSLKTVDFSLHSTGRAGWRSKVSINDASLYDDVLLA